MRWFAKGVLVTLGSLALVVPSPAQEARPVLVEALDAMPQGRASDGRGIMNDAVLEALRRIGLTGTLEFHPWKRAQVEVATGKDRLITSLSRTPEREQKFTWLFPVFRYDRAFVTANGKVYGSFAEAKAALHHVIVTLGGAQYDILIRAGFSPGQLTTVEFEREIAILSMLSEGHGDAWFVPIPEARFALRGLPSEAKFVIGPAVGEGTDQYVAGSKDFNPDLADRLRRAGADMLADGTLARIVKQYQ